MASRTAHIEYFELPVAVMPKQTMALTCKRNREYLKKLKDNVAVIQQAVYAGTCAPLCRTGTVLLHTWFVCEAPKRVPKDARGLVDASVWARGCTPDEDNLRKQLKDALEGILYLDDKQVVGGATLKTYGVRPMVYMCIENATTEAVAGCAEMMVN